MRMKELYCPNGEVNYKPLVDSMAPIIKTATNILEQVAIGSVKVSHSTGTVLGYFGMTSFVNDLDC